MQTIFTLEKVKEITNQAPETRHEEWFQETYGDLISEALLKLTTPEDPTNPGNCWTTFKQVYQGINHRHECPHTSQKGSSNHTLFQFPAAQGSTRACIKKSKFASPNGSDQFETFESEIHNHSNARNLLPEQSGHHRGSQ